MNIELTSKKKEERIKEKLIEAVSKPINIDKEASENNIEDANPIETIKCYLHRLDRVSSMKLFYGCQLGNLLEKCFLRGKETYKDALMECKMGLLSTKTIQTLSRLQKTHNHHPILTIHHPKELRSNQTNM